MNTVSAPEEIRFSYFGLDRSAIAYPTFTRSMLDRARLRARAMLVLCAFPLKRGEDWAARIGDYWFVIDVDALDAFGRILSGTYHIDDFAEFEVALRAGLQRKGWAPVVVDTEGQVGV